VAARRIGLVTTGGTIDSQGASPLDLAWYTESGRRLEAGALTRSVRELCPDIELVELPFPRVSSTAITATQWLELSRLIAEVARSATLDGVVITHGTNTLEETAYFLDLASAADLPVVLCGAMRPASAVSSDGLLNLVRAVQVAADDAAAAQGVLVVMNDRIFAARDVTKAATFRVDAFRAPDTGPLGYADADGRVIFYHRRARRSLNPDAFDLGARTSLPRVDVLVSHVDADGLLVDAAVSVGAAGIVSAGAGAGRVTPLEEAAFDRAVRAGVVVCQGSRVGSGRVSRTPSLRAKGIITADNLPPWKARILLSLGLTRTKDPATLQALFDAS
jgi:L-asparaginase